MKIIKRSGMEVEFDRSKIIAAVKRANNSVVEAEKVSDEQVEKIAENVETICDGMNRALNVEEIQDLVENQIMNQKAFRLASNYITYRYKRALVRKSNSTDKQILSLLECNNEEVIQENSNKNPTVNSVQRDYMAGEVSKDITRRFLLPPEIVEAHESGVIHFHDSDYFAQHMHNCCLVNLEDMLQNGTVISDVMIEKPKSFSTACNIATQAVAQIASSQYGGQSITLSHLVPFVQISREKYRRDVRCIIKVFPDKLERSTTSLILKSTKTESSCRTIFMTSALKEELKKWLNQLAADERKDPTRYHDSGMLFRLPNGLAIEPVLIRKKFLKWQDAHPEFPRIVFHGLRHSSATYQLMISGGDVKAVQGTTGHATADMLVNTYAHIQQSSRVELGKKFEEGFYAKQESPSPQAVNAAGEPTISMTALLELLKNADPEVKAQLRLALLT